MTAALLCVWIGLAVAPPMLWHRQTGAWKRRHAPWWMVALGVYALLLVPALTGGTVSGIVPGLVIIVLTASAIAGTRYCDVCGAMAISFRWWAPPDRCPRCGVAFGPAARA